MKNPPRPDSISQFFKEIKSPTLTREEELDLLIKAQGGDKKSRDIVIKSQLKFAMGFVRKYQGLGLTLEDLIQYGSIGICTAIDSFDVTKGYRFSTFARWKILGEVSNALSKEGNTVRIPHSRKERSQTIKSISDPTGEEGNSNYGDSHLEGDEVKPHLDEDLHKDLMRALEKIKPRQAEAICRFFGFGYEHSQTMKEIGKEMGIGAEGARLLVRGAERSLKKIKGIDNLRDYL
jgi:RNA polymerase sigma factor (sigma-70 family)